MIKHKLYISLILIAIALTGCVEKKYSRERIVYVEIKVKPNNAKKKENTLSHANN